MQKARLLEDLERLESGVDLLADEHETGAGIGVADVAHERPERVRLDGIEPARDHQAHGRHHGQRARGVDHRGHGRFAELVAVDVERGEGGRDLFADRAPDGPQAPVDEIALGPVQAVKRIDLAPFDRGDGIGPGGVSARDESHVVVVHHRHG